jgi:tRNA-2-methylthio-N6-dimethylallyladenosine synthase
VDEVSRLADRGYKEVTLLGQNVNSYRDGDRDFADLMRDVAAVDRSLRVRFTTSHPEDMSAKLIEVIATTDNICKHIHLPVQSGSDRILDLMNRTYSVDQYRRLVRRIRSAMPEVSLTTDIISGFPSEAPVDHELTMDLLREIEFDGAYTFKYSPRENTRAWAMPDTVPEEEKGIRVMQIAELQHAMTLKQNRSLIGTVERVLVEGPSRKRETEYTGRTDRNRTVVFPRSCEQRGDYADIRIERVNSATLFGERIEEARS